MFTWIRSSFCTWDPDQCVEVRTAPYRTDIEVRDSKLGDDSPVLVFTPSEWDAFVAGVKNGDFDRLRETDGPGEPVTEEFAGSRSPSL